MQPNGWLSWLGQEDQPQEIDAKMCLLSQASELVMVWYARLMKQRQEKAVWDRVNPASMSIGFDAVLTLDGLPLPRDPAEREDEQREFLEWVKKKRAQVDRWTRLRDDLHRNDGLGHDGSGLQPEEPRLDYHDWQLILHAEIYMRRNRLLGPEIPQLEPQPVHDHHRLNEVPGHHPDVQPVAQPSAQPGLEEGHQREISATIGSSRSPSPDSSEEPAPKRQRSPESPSDAPSRKRHSVRRFFEWFGFSSGPPSSA